MDDRKDRVRNVYAREDAAAKRALQGRAREPSSPNEPEAWSVERARLHAEVLRARQEVEQTRLERDHLLAQMREANERLVIASVRADELAEQADSGRESAEILAAQLAESEQQLRAALAAGKMAYWRKDLETNRVAASDSIHDVLGLLADTTLRSDAQEFFLMHANDVREHRAVVEAAERERGGWQHEFPIVRPCDHGLAWIEESATSVVNSVTDKRELVGLVRDITERKRAEDLLREKEQHTQALLAEAMAARAEAEAANRAKDEFLAIVNHELRTPLAAIFLWARALETAALHPTERARAIEAIVQSARSQSQLIEDLIDLSRLTSGRFTLSTSAIDLAVVVAAAVDMVQPTMTAKGIAFDVQMTPASIVAALDAHRMKQILGNILTNAAKFTHPGGAVRLVVRGSDGRIEIELSDTGDGIPSEFMPYVFERFSQADMSDTRRHKGLGIGLAITKQLVELHGGSIEAQSDGVGRGAVFRIHIPWSQPATGSEPPHAPTPASPNPCTTLSGLRICLVESDANTRDAMQWTLSREGADVSVLGTGEAALTAFQTAAPDILISELGLPDMSGYELMARVVELSRKHGRPPPPSCAVSGHTRPADRRQAIEAGFDMFLAKPVTPQDLVEAVRDLREVLVGT